MILTAILVALGMFLIGVACAFSERLTALVIGALTVITGAVFSPLLFGALAASAVFRREEKA